MKITKFFRYLLLEQNFERTISKGSGIYRQAITKVEETTEYDYASCITVTVTWRRVRQLIKLLFDDISLFNFAFIFIHLRNGKIYKIYSNRLFVKHSKSENI